MESAARYRKTDVVYALAVLLLGTSLFATGTGLAGQWQRSFMMHQEVHPQHLLGILASVVGATLVTWWVLALAAAAAGSLLESLGKSSAAAASRKLSPAFMQRLVLAALSAQLVSGPVATAAVPTPGPEWKPTQGYGTTAPVTPGSSPEEAAGRTVLTEPLDRGGPIDKVLGRSFPDERGENPAPNGVQQMAQDASLPVPSVRNLPPGQDVAPQRDVRNSTTSRALDNIPDGVGWRPAPPPVTPGLLAAPSTRDAAHGAGPDTGSVTVLAGDTLWDIAARALGAGASELEIALQWPRWYEANQTVIGPDADVLLPGQILRPPSAAQQ